MAQERNRLRTVVLAGAVVVAVGALGTVGVAQARSGFDGMWGSGFGGPMIGFMLDHTLGSIDATDAQRETIYGIVDEAATEIETMTSGFDAIKEKVTALLTAETVDRDAMESLRQEALETADMATARALEAFLDAAETLTPEQRADLIEQQDGFRAGFGPRFGPGRS